MQTDYSLQMAGKSAGLVADTRISVIESAPAFGAVGFGVGVVSGISNADTVRKPSRNVATIVFGGDLVTSNTINGSVNGTAIAEVTFTTNHLNTMNLIKAAIETVLTALSLTGTVTVGGASNRTLTITLTGASENASLLLASWVVAAGAGQASVTLAHTTNGAFQGVATLQQKGLRSDGTGGYADKETVGVLRRGAIWVQVNDAVAKDADAYLVLADNGEEGRFTDVSTGNLGPVGKFRGEAADNALVLLEINLP